MNFISADLEKYCIRQSNHVPDYLNELERTTHIRTIAPQMLSGKLMGRFLSFISHMLRPTCIVEVGTFTGYSSLCLAEGLAETGKLHTFEINDELEPIINEYFNQSPYRGQIKLYLGAAEDLLPDLDLEPDLAFLDAGKIEYDLHYEILLNKMKPGGIILVDNVLWSGKVLSKAVDVDTRALQLFNEKVAADTRCAQVMLPIRDGLTMLRVL